MTYETIIAIPTFGEKNELYITSLKHSEACELEKKLWKDKKITTKISDTDDSILCGTHEVTKTALFGKLLDVIHLCEFSESLAIEKSDFQIIKLENEIIFISDNERVNYKITSKFELADFNYYYLEYINMEEKQFGDIYRKLQKSQNIHPSRAGNAVSIYGASMEFDVRYVIPVNKYRKQAVMSAIKEMLFYLKGFTNSKKLESWGVNTWKAQTSAEFLKKQNLEIPEGEMGPSYGWQFRKFGADSSGSGGVDQISKLISEIKNNPNSRRLVISLWNPVDIEKMALPPCMFQFQFIVRNEKFLDIHAHMRSSDFILAGNWNVIQAAAFLYMISHVCGLKPGKVYWSAVDVHAYENHLDERIENMLDRECIGTFPRLMLVDPPSEFDDFEPHHFKILGYKCEKNIKFHMNE